MSSNPDKDQIEGLTIWSVVLIVVAVIVVCTVALSYILPRKPKQEPSPTPSVTEKPTSEPTEKTQEPNTISSYIGTIENIKDGIIRMKVEKERNRSLEEDGFFEVEIGDETKILSLEGELVSFKKFGEDIKVFTINHMDGTIEESEPQILTLVDLKKGDSITVLPGENIRGRESFLAQYIIK